MHPPREPDYYLEQLGHVLTVLMIVLLANVLGYLMFR
jgi:hypothetical protein